MTAEEIRSILTIALMAAFADGLKDEGERAAVKRVAEALGPEAGFDLPGLYREVLLAKPDLAPVAASLQSQEARQLAYEMAVGRVRRGRRAGSRREGVPGPAGRVAGAAVRCGRRNQCAADEVRRGRLCPTDAPRVPAHLRPPRTVAGTVMGKSSLSDAEMDKVILNAAVTNAALELLPETLASMAIIPLQMRLVYRIGQAHGYTMDRTHAKDFLATLGVGLTSQYLEQFGRKLLGRRAGRTGRRSRSNAGPASGEFRPDVSRLPTRSGASRSVTTPPAARWTLRRSSRPSPACSTRRAASHLATASRSSRRRAPSTRAASQRSSGSPELSGVRDRVRAVGAFEVRHGVEGDHARDRAAVHHLGDTRVPRLQVELDCGLRTCGERVRDEAADHPARGHDEHGCGPLEACAGLIHGGRHAASEVPPASRDPRSRPRGATRLAARRAPP